MITICYHLVVWLGLEDHITFLILFYSTYFSQADASRT